MDGPEWIDITSISEYWRYRVEMDIKTDKVRHCDVRNFNPLDNHTERGEKHLNAIYDWKRGFPPKN